MLAPLLEVAIAVEARRRRREQNDLSRLGVGRGMLERLGEVGAAVALDSRGPGGLKVAVQCLGSLTVEVAGDTSVCHRVAQPLERLALGAAAEDRANAARKRLNCRPRG